MTLTTKRERRGKGALARVEWSTAIDAPMTAADIRKFMRQIAKRGKTLDLGSVLADYKKAANRILKAEKADSSIAIEAQGILNCCRVVSCHVAKGDATQAAYAGMRLENHMMRMRVINEKRSGPRKKNVRTQDTKKCAIELFKDYRKAQPRQRTGEVVNAVMAGLRGKGHTVSEKILRGWLSPLMPKNLRKAGRPPKD